MESETKDDSAGPIANVTEPNSSRDSAPAISPASASIGDKVLSVPGDPTPEMSKPHEGREVQGKQGFKTGNKAASPAKSEDVAPCEKDDMDNNMSNVPKAISIMGEPSDEQIIHDALSSNPEGGAERRAEETDDDRLPGLLDVSLPEFN